ncbi:hypothetical protein [Chromobacterium sp. IIBBL 290-4]|uniref:hypothetical protein n=1 Tax=Chromobacterium sp. IIBBL 290-4 TaxID=2953890 RepID=UPI0020B8E18F|nr:hypothetical protein [Chromobacterium sp. IIBBL 290-4]UTH75815.1 hypothetical protein NKT35_06860 [Chromobacterium sp. IIBBL 290-4]
MCKPRLLLAAALVSPAMLVQAQPDAQGCALGQSATNALPAQTQAVLPDSHSDFPLDHPVMIDGNGLPTHAALARIGSLPFQHAAVEANALDNDAPAAEEDESFRLAALFWTPATPIEWMLSYSDAPLLQDHWDLPSSPRAPIWQALPAQWGILPPATLLEAGFAPQTMGPSAQVWLGANWHLEAADLHYQGTSLSLFGATGSELNRVQGEAPYWRLSFADNWGGRALELGIFGLRAHLSTDPFSEDASSDLYRDAGVDMQFTWGDDARSISTQAYWIREQVNWDAAHLGYDHQSPVSEQTSWQWKTAYWYQQRYGAALSWFRVDGSANNLIYTRHGRPRLRSPATSGYVAELDYAPSRDWMIGLQHTAYRSFMGASRNYDGFGRDASDNNSTYLFIARAF